MERTIRVVGQFKTANDIANIIVKGGQGNALYLRDFAEVKFTDAKRESYARLNHNPVIALNVIKRSGENLIEASEGIEKTIEELRKTSFPEDLEIVITNDLSSSTKTAINELINTVIIGFILVTLVLLFFMGVRNAVFVGLAVPLSSFISFLILPGLDFTFNMMVTFSLLLAIGIVVDNAIVVVENTYRLHTKEGLEIKEAARIAAGEVFQPVLTGSITTIAPFFPLLFWPGIIGEFMYFLPAVLIIVLTASLIVAFLFNPVFALQFMESGESKPTDNKTFIKNVLIAGGIAALLHIFAMGGDSDLLKIIANLIIWGIVLTAIYKYLLHDYVIVPFHDKFLPWCIEGYRKIIKVIIIKRRPFLVLAATMVILILATALLIIRAPQVEFFPNAAPNSAIVYIEMPLGTRAAVTDSVTKIIEDKVFQIVGENNPLVKSIQSNVAIGAGDPRDPDRNPKSHQGKITVSFVEFAERNGKSTWDILENIRNGVKGMPGVSIKVDKEQSGPPTGKPINIEIQGEDLVELTQISDRLKNYIVDSSGIKGIENLKSDLELNKPEVILTVDREKANKEGISSMQVAIAIRTALYGWEADKFTKGEDDYDIMIRIDEAYRYDIPTLLNLRVSFRDATGAFRQIPISSVVNMEYADSYGGINRINNNRVVTLSSNVLEGYNANEIIAQIKAQTKDFNLPNGYEIRFTGEQEDQQETADFLSLAFMVAVVLVILTLVFMFNSVIKSLIILSAIFFSLIGVFAGHALTGMEIVIVMTGVGIIALAGIVVNNGILLIDFTDELLRRGEKTRTAIIEGGAIRFTPVILTKLTTLLGLFPLAFGMNIEFYSLLTDWSPHINFDGNDNTAFFAPLAWAIIFGLTFSTFLTLLVVPSMYMIQHNLKVKYNYFRLKGKSMPVALILVAFKRLPNFKFE